LFYHKVIEIREATNAPVTDLQDLDIMLGSSCALQEKCTEAEGIISPIAFAKGIRNVQAFHGIYAMAIMSQFGKGYYVNTTRLCKRAASGYKKLLCKSDPQYHQAMSILAMLYDVQEDFVSAEACRTFIQMDTSIGTR
jgi:hypothetical protein